MTALAESRPSIAIPPAALLFAGEADHLEAEKMMEGCISRIFDDGWHGWDWNPVDMSVDVYAAYTTPEHIGDLIALGFAIARIHPHGATIRDCSCTSHRSDQ